MTVDTFSKLSKTVHNQFHKTFVEYDFPKRLENALRICKEFYQKIRRSNNNSTRYYHDEHHVDEVTECLSKLICQYAHHAPSTEVQLTQKMFEYAIVAALFHDTGYFIAENQTIQLASQDHEKRSAETVCALLPHDEWSQQELQYIQNIILGTHPALFHEILKKTNEDLGLQFLIKALRTADYIGQMGQPDYIDRLPLLFEETQKACAITTQHPYKPSFSSPDELISQTPEFWNHVYQEILQKECSNLYQYLVDPFPNGPNPYLKIAQHNADRLRKIKTSD